MLERGELSFFNVPCFTDKAMLEIFESLSLTALGRTPMGAAYYARAEPGLGKTVTTQPRELFLLTVMIRPVNGTEMWRDGRSFRRAHIPAGGMALLDHRSAWSTLLEDAFELFDLYIPVAAITEVFSEFGHRDLDTLQFSLEQTNVDPVVYHLALSLLPLVRGERPSTLLFVEHVFEALTLHLARTYGGLVLPDPPVRGGLAPFHERRVKDMMLSDLKAEPSLTELAGACGLSNRHFIRAFKVSSGAPPHRWLLQQKIKRATDLLVHDDISISEISIICGFADQSHFTRMFKRTTGSSPARWRRQNRF